MTNIRVVNKCPVTVWPGVSGSPTPSQPGPLASGTQVDLAIPANLQSGRIWPAEGCSGPGMTGCVNGMVPPMSLAELTLGTAGIIFYQ
jgi:hypothetical protein